VARSRAWAGEFLPPLDEGDLLYMPSALAGAFGRQGFRDPAAHRRLIKQVPEVARVFGKIGRAESATDPAPLEMVETTIQFKPRDQWRPGMTPEKLVEGARPHRAIAGSRESLVPPIRNRIDMLATGIKSPVGIKVAGADLAGDRPHRARHRAGGEGRAGVTSALAERPRLAAATWTSR
jgi:Cu(I)/Ag(I) efflux system membrane protein CusA/SilA